MRYSGRTTTRGLSSARSLLPIVQRAAGHQAGRRWGPASAGRRGALSAGKTGAGCSKDWIHSTVNAEIRGGSTGWVARTSYVRVA
jgi:hypothetical protein